MGYMADRHRTQVHGYHGDPQTGHRNVEANPSGPLCLWWQSRCETCGWIQPDPVCSNPGANDPGDTTPYRRAQAAGQVHELDPDGQAAAMDQVPDAWLREHGV